MSNLNKESRYNKGLSPLDTLHVNEGPISCHMTSFCLSSSNSRDIVSGPAREQ